MFTDYTYEDWLEAPEDKSGLIPEIIRSYRGSGEFRQALTAISYFNAENEGIRNKYLIQLDACKVQDEETGEVKYVRRDHKVEGNRIVSDFFYRFVTQQNQHLLGNGLSMRNKADKDRLGPGFDTMLSRIGEKALVTGTCWGFWNVDHVEMIESVRDSQSGAVALTGEMDGEAHVLIQFWRVNSEKPMYVRVFETQGMTTYRTEKNGRLEKIGQSAYRLVTAKDELGEIRTEGGHYGRLPVIPLYANDEHRSMLRPSIRSKIDAFDRILSDFGDNLEMANEVIWVLNNFGGDRREILSTIAQIRELRAVVNVSDGTGGGSTAEQQRFEVPYEARKTAMELLRGELYRDAMAMDTEALSGTSLSPEAIMAAARELNLKCDRYEWQVFAFVQNLLALLGVLTEKISFKRQEMFNVNETIRGIYQAENDLDRRTRLRMNPMVAEDEIEAIMAARKEEKC